MTVYEKGDGVRRRYHALLGQEAWQFPRAVKLHRSAAYILGPEPMRRPLFAIYGMAKLAEYMLHGVRVGRNSKGRAERECAEFYAATRRTMQNVLSTYPVDRPLSAPGLRAVRRMAEELRETGARAWRARRKKSDETPLTPSAEL